LAARTNSALLRAGKGSRSRVAALREIVDRLPPFEGSPITVSVLDELLAGRNRPASAAASIPARKIMIESALFGQPAELRRILIHELFHFVWVRLSNPGRWSYEALLQRELASHAGGELGWSAEHRKRALPDDAPLKRSRRWRDYVSESFCDTAGWWFGEPKTHPEFTLARRHRDRRAAWFRNLTARDERIAL
jgi:hypothetical protein